MVGVEHDVGVVLDASTVRLKVKVWAVGLKLFVAVIVNELLLLLELAGGVPARVAVPSPLSVNVSHDGSLVPPNVVADNAHVGEPVEVTVKVPAWPAIKVVARSGLWMRHTEPPTVRVKVWVA